MDSELAVSVLDLVGMRAGEPAGSAIARSVDLAQHVEQLGYKRYWLAEHHSIPGLACSATPVLIGHVAAATKTIRVGSGGVMLPNDAGFAKRFAAEWRGFPGAPRRIADLPGPGAAWASGESDSRTGQQCADHVTRVERLQCTTGGDAGTPVRIRGALCS